MEECPLVSVCIPAYNSEETIGKTLDSIVNQDYSNIEIIISDNHSTDGTARIVKQYKKYNVKYYLNPLRPEDLINTSSVVSNFNYVISLAKGEYIAIYHSDDIYDSSIVRREAQFLQQNSSAGCVFTSAYMIDESDKILKVEIGVPPGKTHKTEIIDYDTLLNSLFLLGHGLMCPSIMIRSEALSEVGYFNPAESRVSDIEYYLRLARWKPLGLLSEKLLYYRFPTGPKYQTIEKGLETRRQFRCFMDEYMKRPEVKPYVKSESLKNYEITSYADNVLLAMYCFSNGENNEARTLLNSYRWNYIWVASNNKKLLLVFILGMVLVIAEKLGCSSIFSKAMRKFNYYRFRIHHRRSSNSGLPTPLTSGINPQATD
jgi:glycosyltransferase involved in cell wall biosynthesis